MGLALCQEKRWPKAGTKYRDKSAKGKYDPDYADRTKEEDSEEEFYYDRNSATTGYYESGSLDALAAYRNNRAIDTSRYIIIRFRDMNLMFFLIFLVFLYIYIYII